MNISDTAEREPEILVDEPAARLAVSRPSTGLPTPVIIAIFALLAVALFLVLNGRRGQAEARSLTTPAPDSAPSEPAPPLQLAPSDAVPPPLQAPSSPAPMGFPSPPAAIPAAPPPVSPNTNDMRQRLAAPAVVVDLSAARPVVLAQASAPAAPSRGEANPGGAMISALEGRPDGSVEAMSQSLRVGGGTTGAAVAGHMGDLGLTVPQGAVIPAVLETAINSDLPGYTRAVVSRDVHSFDGRQVLIPRGSRLIGQYRSAVSLGQSRAFVIWSRVIRPDGVSVQISSPGTDQLGRGGLTGDVDRHFFTRFGGAILLSVLNAGVAAIGETPSTSISIGSPAQAASAADTVQPQRVPPTIKVAQGEAIRIFVARDLDFSAVGAMR